MVAGLAFVLVNAGAVPASGVWRGTAVLVAAAALFDAMNGPRLEADPPSRSTIRTYGFAVTAMVLAIPAGAAVINNACDAPDAVPVWVVFVVGAHFWPFARAFDLPVFRWLAATLVVTSLVGAVAVLIGDDSLAAGWTGVAAGFIMLAFADIGPRLSRA